MRKSIVLAVIVAAVMAGTWAQAQPVSDVVAPTQPTSGSTPLTTSKPAEEPKIVIARLTVKVEGATRDVKTAENQLEYVKSQAYNSEAQKVVYVKNAQDFLTAAKAKLAEANTALADYKKSLLKPTSMPATKPTSGSTPLTTSRPAITDTQPAAGYETY
jgi:hypothetical protein